MLTQEDLEVAHECRHLYRDYTERAERIREKIADNLADLARFRGLDSIISSLQAEILDLRDRAAACDKTALEFLTIAIELEE